MNIEDKPLEKVDWNLRVRSEHQAFKGGNLTSFTG